MIKKILGGLFALFGYQIISAQKSEAYAPKNNDVDLQPSIFDNLDPIAPIKKVAADIDNQIRYALGDKSLPRGIRNNNAGNLVQTNIPWQGKLQNPTDDRFEQFESPVWGLRAIYKDIINDYNKGSGTLRDLINEYAPSFENNTNAYINSVSAKTGIKPDERFDLNQTNLVNIVKAIVVHENGQGKINPYWYDDEIYKDAYRKAVA